MNGAVTALDALPADRDVRRVSLRACAVVATAATAVTAVVAASGPASDPALVAAARATTVAVPAAVGLHAIARRRGERFGVLLLVLAAAWFLTTFAESGSDSVYTFGRIAVFVAEPVLVAVLLAYPTGRLETRLDRALVAGTGLVALVLFLPRAFLAASFQVPSPFTSCTAHCPDNPLFAFDRQAAFVDGAMKPA